LLLKYVQSIDFIADVKIAYLIRNNYFSVGWHDKDIKTYQSYGYFWQASVGWNINDRNKDHYIYMGPFIVGKIYDTHINRNQYTAGITISNDFYRRLFKIPLICVYKMYIPVIDYTESTSFPLFFSKYTFNWQHTLTVCFALNKRTKYGELLHDFSKIKKKKAKDLKHEK
jgi:hypothetical protein